MDKIICIGKNYLSHVAELGDIAPEKPVIFIKPRSVLRVAVENEELTVDLPKNFGSVHYETEIVIRLDKGGYKLDLKEAEKAIGAVSIGLDMTLRDLQSKQKKAGEPWTTSKVFPNSAIIGPWRRVSEFSNYLEEKFMFSLDNIVKQEGYGKDMTLSPAECIAYASEFFPLVAGDLVFTGTPVGVGPVAPMQRGELSYGSIYYSILWKNEN